MARKSSRVKLSASEESMNDDDRISRLPDELIHRIFSFLDTKFVIRSSLLSRRWRYKWESHPELNFVINPSPNKTSVSKFPNFVHHFLSARDHMSNLSSIDFRSNSIRLPVLKEIVTYAMLHKIKTLKIEFFGDKQTRRGGLDSSLFRSQDLQHLDLSIDFEFIIRPPQTWHFPALTTLSMNRVTFTLERERPNNGASESVDLFSQIPNLKTLTLVNCVFLYIDTFIITSSKLESLSLIAPRHSCKFVVSAPMLSSFTFYGMPRFTLLAKDLISLKTVNFQTIYGLSFRNDLKFVELMINTFQQLYKANSIVLNLDALKFLSQFPELLGRRNCPFTSLQSLTLVSSELPRSLTAFVGVVDYFRCSSPALKFYVELDPALKYHYYWT